MSEGRRPGRPTIWTPEVIEDVKKQFEEFIYAKNDKDEYVNSPPSPSLFAFTIGINRQRLYEIPELKELVELCITKKEHDLEYGALTGKINPSMAIFSLKQIGWSDKLEAKLEQKNIVFDASYNASANGNTKDSGQAAD